MTDYMKIWISEQTKAFIMRMAAGVVLLWILDKIKRHSSKKKEEVVG